VCPDIHARAQGAALVKKMGGVILFDIEGEKWLLDLKSGNGSVTKGEGATKPELIVTMSDDTFFDISQGKLNSQQVGGSAEPMTGGASSFVWSGPSTGAPWGWLVTQS
jgi:hypothetical protein